MKLFISIILFYIFSLSSILAKPECPGSPYYGNDLKKISHWHNCIGTHKFSYTSGDFVDAFYEGPFMNGSPNGFGYFENKISGHIANFVNGYPNGMASYFFKDGDNNGDKFMGEIVQGKITGYGTYIFVDGTVWQGNWQDGNFVSGKKYKPGEFNQTIRFYERPVYNFDNTNEASKDNYDSDKLIPAASGSGFIISELGHIVSNNHVIQGCETVKAHHKGKSFEATILATDTINDLALLQVDFSPSTVFSISQNNTELMQDVFVAGYPFGISVSSSVKVTKGIVSSLAGIGNNYSNMQIDAALQPGNSGGPILDEKGNVLGVAVAKLDLAVAMEKFGVVPEGTNFGIKSSVLKNFLQSNSIDLKTPIKDKISRSELSKKITDGTLFLSCWMTYAQIEKLKTQKVMFKDLQ